MQQGLQVQRRYHSACVKVMDATADKQGKVTDVTIWRAGFMEEREVLVGDPQHEVSQWCR
jgi:hypothetical protein